MSSASRISIVQQDVLWRVFTLIATSRPSLDEKERPEDEQHKAHPLTMMRNLSQVCFAWRSLAVGSSSLWGYMIDVSFMGKSSEMWRSLITDRTKEAPLCVYGDVLASHNATRQFFSSLLSNDWPRISELDVDVYSCDLFDTKLWTVFWEQPAVHLNRFSITFQNSSLSEPVNIVQGGGKLFKDQALSLKAFHATQFDVAPQASWISGLRELTLCSHLSASQVLHTLSGIPSLEILNFTSGGYHFSNIHEPSSPHGPLRQISLPHLRRLYISSTFQMCSTLLSKISLPQNVPYSIVIMSRNAARDSEITIGDIESFTPVLVSCAQRFLLSYMMTELAALFMDVGYFSVAFNHPLQRNNYPPPLPSIINIENSSRFPPMSHSHFIKALSTCHLSALKTFTLITSNSGKTINPADPNFQSFLLSLYRIETLIVPEASLQLLNGVDLDVSTIFPSLKYLRLDFWSKRVSHDFDDSIILFLSRRAEAGIPVVELDISRFVDEFGDQRDWTFLDSVHGLRVVWTTKGMSQEYVCGTGSPDSLNFLTSQ